MTIRFSDNLISEIETSDFIVRNRIPRSAQIAIIFLAAFDIICFAAYILNDSSITAAFLIILMLSIGMLGFITFYFINRFRKLILATEFQTAMLASAAQLGTRFCFIVNSEGMIFYVDPGFQKFFTNFIDSGSRTLKSLLAFAEVPAEPGNKLFTAIKQGKSDHLMLTFPGKDGQQVNVMTTIDVLPRPRGYSIIRGRDYVEKRSQEKTVGIADDDKTTIALLDQSLYHLAGGILIANSNGRIVHVNGEFEKWLSYEPGEVVKSPIRIGQIFSQYAGHDPGVLFLNDFEGEVIIQRKDRTMISMKVQQKLLSSGNQAIGVSAFIDLHGNV